MKLLLDTNLFLEIILDQENASDVQNLLCKTETYELFLTDYSLHSIGLLLFRQKQHMVFCKFIEDIIFSNAVQVLSLSAIDLESVANNAQLYQLDFDDAYQHTTAKKYGLALVSFDKHFDKTEIGRKVPSELL